MKNTSIQLTDSTSAKILELLAGVAEKKRDAAWHLLNKEVTKVCGIWKNIDQRNKNLVILKQEVRKDKAGPITAADIRGGK